MVRSVERILAGMQHFLAHRGLQFLLCCSGLDPMVSHAELSSGTYRVNQPAEMTECGDRLDASLPPCAGSAIARQRILPLIADVTLQLEASPPQATATIFGAVLEGDPPFTLVVESSSGYRMDDGGYRFDGNYLGTISTVQGYLFEWTFRPRDASSVLWNGQAFWTGGHIWSVAHSDIIMSYVIPEPSPWIWLLLIVPGIRGWHRRQLIVSA